jgi:predicted  nucleic acid-binding Zn-ribbon protein
MGQGQQPVAARQYLAFDHYQRYRLVTDIVKLVCEQTGEALEGRTVLDLGGVQGFARTFLPRPVGITTANVQRSPYDRPEGENDTYVIVGEGPLPFADDAFDFVITCDVLEHVPAEKRNGFVTEIARVARRAAIVLAPFDTPGVKEAEALVSAVYESIFHAPYRWLQEHTALSLPELESTATFFRGLFRSYAIMPSSHLPNWLVLMSVNVVLARHPHTAALNQQLTDLYASLYYPSDQREPAYRYALIGLKGVANLDLSILTTGEERADAAMLPASAVFGVAALGAWRDLAEDLARAQGDLNRAVVDRRAAGAALRAQVKRVRDSEAERDQARNELAALRSALDRAAARLQGAAAQRDEAQNMATALRSRLAEVSEEKAEAEAALATRQRELEALMVAHDQAAAQRDEAQDMATALRSRLAEVSEEKAEAAAALAAMRRELAALMAAHDQAAARIQQLSEVRDEARQRLSELSARMPRGGARRGS